MWKEERERTGWIECCTSRRYFCYDENEMMYQQFKLMMRGGKNPFKHCKNTKQRRYSWLNCKLRWMFTYDNSHTLASFKCSQIKVKNRQFLCWKINLKLKRWQTCHQREKNLIKIRSNFPSLLPIELKLIENVLNVLSFHFWACIKKLL